MHVYFTADFHSHCVPCQKFGGECFSAAARRRQFKKPLLSLLINLVNFLDFVSLFLRCSLNI